MRSDGATDLIGEIVWAMVSNAIENRSSRGKWRPVVRVVSNGGQWGCVGLTTKATAADGRSRPAVPNWESAGLPSPGWLWGDRLVRVATIDVGSHIGWLDRELAGVIISHVRLPRHHAVHLWYAACEADGVAPSIAPHPDRGPSTHVAPRPNHGGGPRH